MYRFLAFGFLSDGGTSFDPKMVGISFLFSQLCFFFVCLGHGFGRRAALSFLLLKIRFR